ncbi:hypothetical protein ABTY23_29530, partial [Streptomyces sp. NPDC096068]
LFTSSLSPPAAVSALSRLAVYITAQPALVRMGETLEVLVESLDEEDGWIGRAAHQAPETDGQVVLVTADGTDPDLAPGRMVRAKVVGTEGVDLVAECLFEEAGR